MNPSARAAWTAARPATPGSHPVDAACVAPWVSMELDPQGWVYACCANQTYPLGRIGDERLRDLWHGSRAAVLRDALSRWDLTVGCIACRYHVEHGRTDTDAAVYDRYPFAEPAPAGPASITFALSNRCNLACVMCNGELSSTIRRRDGHAAIVNRYDDAFFDDLAEMLPGLQYAKFLGGEPFLVPEHERVWDLMTEVGGPARLQVTTNGTVWTDRVETVLDRFAVDVTVSLDAHDPGEYERIRIGADHAAVMRNVARFRSYCLAQGTQLRFCFCLMASNTSELAPFLRWADDLDVPVSVNLVTDTGFALHDLALEPLLEVDARWEQFDAMVSAAGRNREVWDTQRRQLHAVIDERRRGQPPPPRHALPAPPGFLDADALRIGGASADVSASTEIDRLARWSGDGPVAVVHADATGTITDVAAPHPRLGLVASIVGRSLRELVDVIGAADRRAVWLIDVAPTHGTLVRTLVLSTTTPGRGTGGTVVRTVAWPTARGSILLVAEDRIHERSAPGAVPVAIGQPRPVV